MHLLAVFDDDYRSFATIGRWLARALLDGGSVLVLAAADHESVLLDTMLAEGADVAAARADGRLVELDPALALARVVPEGDLDASSFDSEIGRVVRAAAARGGPVRVYGEMVALLWERGRIDAVFDLESRWDDLITEVSFSLICGYPVSALSSPELLDELRRLHSAPKRTFADLFGGGGDVRLAQIPCSPEAPAEGRRFVGETLATWGMDSLSETAAIVVSELATNAVLHAASTLLVVIERSAGGVRIGVADDSDLAPVVLPATGKTGKGLHIVAGLAADWGAEALPDGKAVWADLRA